MTALKQIDNFPLSKAIVLPESGFVRFVAPIARATNKGEKGFLNISKKDGKPYYQRVSKDVLERTKNSFLVNPVTLTHPPEFVKSNNGTRYTRGLTGSSKDSIIQIDNYQFCTGTIFDEELIQSIRDKVAHQISPGYDVTLSPVMGQNDVLEQVNRVGNHLAFLRTGRQGDKISLQLDESEIYWDYCSEFQLDEAELQLIKNEINALPENVLDLSFTEQKIDLDRVKLPTDNKKKTMKVNLVTDKQTVIEVETETPEELTNYIGRLKDSNDQKQTDAAELTNQQTKTIASLEAQVEALKEAPKQQQTDAAEVQKKAQALVVEFMKMLPVLQHYKVQLDGVEDPIELKRKAIIEAFPAKAEVFKALQLDQAADVGRIEGFYEVAELQVSTQATQPEKQTDASEDRSAFTRAFQSILTNGGAAVTQQTDSEDTEGEKILAQAREIAENAWKNA